MPKIVGGKGNILDLNLSKRLLVQLDASSVAYAPEQAYIADASVYENVVCGISDTGNSVDGGKKNKSDCKFMEVMVVRMEKELLIRALTTVDFLEEVKRMPEGLNTFLVGNG